MTNRKKALQELLAKYTLGLSRVSDLEYAPEISKAPPGIEAKHTALAIMEDIICDISALIAGEDE